VEGGRPRSGDGTLLCPAQLPGALESVAANGLIGINSIDDFASHDGYDHFSCTDAIHTLGTRL
jgi:hypothetical protein